MTYFVEFSADGIPIRVNVNQIASVCPALSKKGTQVRLGSGEQFVTNDDVHKQLDDIEDQQHAVAAALIELAKQFGVPAAVATAPAAPAPPVPEPAKPEPALARHVQSEPPPGPVVERRKPGRPRKNP